MRVEVRSVNHRDLQITFRVPDSFRVKESELQKQLERHVRRGHLYLWLTLEASAGDGDSLIDEDRMRSYLQALQRVADEQGVPANIELTGLLRLPGAMREPEAIADELDTLWPRAVETVEAAIVAMVAMRRAEGANLLAQFHEIAAAIESLVATIEGEQGSFVQGYRDRLRQRVNRLLEGAGVAVDEGALAREVAIFADRSDVSEEIARLRSHLAQLREALAGEEEVAVGRRMEFLGQEMLREAGTIAAKVPAGPQVRHVLELKTHVERLREQVRNVE